MIKSFRPFTMEWTASSTSRRSSWTPWMRTPEPPRSGWTWVSVLSNHGNHQLNPTGPDREGRGPELPELSGVAAEEVGLWLGEVHLLQDGDLLGHQAAQMGSQRKEISSLLSVLMCYLQGRGDTSGGCKCMIDGRTKCHKLCNYCHWQLIINIEVLNCDIVLELYRIYLYSTYIDVIISR